MTSPFHQITFFYRENGSKKLFQSQRRTVNLLSVIDVRLLTQQNKVPR